MFARLALVVFFVVVAQSLSAATIPLTLDITDGTNTVAVSVDAEVIRSGSGTFTSFRVSDSSSTPGWEIEWTLRGEVHNEIRNVDDLHFQLRIRNASDLTSAFIISAHRPVSELFPVDLYGGGFSGSFRDLTGDGATLSTVGEPLYMSLIDGVGFVPVLAHPFSGTAAPNSAIVFLENVFPGPSGHPFLLGPSGADDIGLRLNFQLTPGDEFFVDAHISMHQVSEPTAHWLAVVGAGVLGFVARFRRNWPVLTQQRRMSQRRHRQGMIELLEPKLPLSANAQLLGQEFTLPTWIRLDRNAELQSRIAAITTANSGSQLYIGTAMSRALISADNFFADPRYDHVDGSSGAGPNGDQPYSIAVLDTGVSYISSFFGGNPGRILFRKDFDLSDGDNPADFHGHGSSVASIAAANTASQIGLATGARILGLKVSNNLGSAVSQTAIQSALQWVIANAATYNIGAVNMSLIDTEVHVDDPLESFASDELAALELMDIVVVSCSGNDFEDDSPDTGPSVPGVSYPAADPNSLAVGAVLDRTMGLPISGNCAGTHAENCHTAPDHIASFAERGSLIDSFASGVALLSSDSSPNGGTTLWSGTSFAAPQVAAAATMAQQLAVEHTGRRLSTSDMRILLRESGDLIYDGDENHNGQWDPGEEDDNVANTETYYPRLNMVTLAKHITAPRVTGLKVGTSLTSAPDYDFADYVGSGDQLKTVPVRRANQVIVQFNEDVDVSSGDIALNGDSYGPLSPSGFQYNSQTSIATWTFPELPLDRWTVTLSDAIEDVDDGTPLDGNWNNPDYLNQVSTFEAPLSTFPSGDWSLGGDFVFRFNILPGDVDRNSVVDIVDLNAVQNHFGSSPPGGSDAVDAWEFGDMNFTGSVDITDLNDVRNNFGEMGWPQDPEESMMMSGGGEVGEEAMRQALLDYYFYRLANPNAEDPYAKLLGSSVLGDEAWWDKLLGDGWEQMF